MIDVMLFVLYTPEGIPVLVGFLFFSNQGAGTNSQQISSAEIDH
jgi:hypothetical protein